MSAPASKKKQDFTAKSDNNSRNTDSGGSENTSHNEQAANMPFVADPRPEEYKLANGRGRVRLVPLMPTHRASAVDFLTREHFARHTLFRALARAQLAGASPDEASRQHQMLTAEVCMQIL